MVSARDEFNLRQMYKRRRRRLWHLVREQYRIGAKWGIDPIPPRHYLSAVLLMEQAVNEAMVLSVAAASRPTGESGAPE